ncbi:hypothetical protein [Oceanithermus sp.]
MKKLLLAIPLLLGASLWFYGCNQTQGTEVTVRLVNAWGTPATATVIYQVGDGEWKLAAQKDYGVYSFMVPPGETRYGVSANCLPLSTLSTLGFFTTYQLTTDDATEVVFPCLNLSDQSFGNVSLTWDASALSGDYFKAFSRLDDASSNTSPLSVGTIIGENEPFLFLAFSGGSDDYANLEGVRFERFDTAPGLTHDVTFTAGDAATFGTLSGPATPSGFNDCELSSALITHDGLFAGGLAQGSGDPCSGDYLRVPGTGSQDARMLMASYRDPVNNRSLLSMAFADANAASVELPELPGPWPADYAVEPAVLPTFDLEHPDGNATGYVIFYSGSNGPWWQVYLSPSWLAGAASYTLPDLSGAPDFGGIKLLKGEEARWEIAAFFSNRPIGDWLGSTTWHPLGGPFAIPVLPGAAMKAASIAGTYPVP